MNTDIRASFMSAAQKKDMAGLKRTHENCREQTGVARPGKTAQERARRMGLASP